MHIKMLKIKNIFLILVFVLFFMAIIPFTKAIDSAIVEYQTLSDNEGYYILGKVDMNMTKDEVKSFNFDFGTIENPNIFVRLNGDYVKLNEIENNLLPYNKLEYEFVSRNLIEDNEFFMIIDSNYYFTRLKIIYALPEGAVLSSQANHGIPIFPKPEKYETDGRIIKAIWEYENVGKDDELAYYVAFENPAYSNFFFVSWILPIGLLILVIGLIIFGFINWGKKRKEKTIKKDIKKETRKRIPKREIKNPKIKSIKKIENTEKVDLHLKEEEEQIYNILKQRDGSCEQGTLLVVSDFSKPKLSRILMEMEERKIIKKVKKGRKNYIFLK